MAHAKDNSKVGYITIATVHQRQEARLIAAKLEAAAIDCLLVDERDTAPLAFGKLGVGEIKIQVKRQDVARTLPLLHVEGDKSGASATADDAPRRIDAVVDMCLLACEPLRQVGRYDFGASDLPARLRQLGFELAIRQRLLRSPPPETMFLHRKLLGSFLLLARLRAQVDARSLILPFLPKAQATPPATGRQTSRSATRP